MKLMFPKNLFVSAILPFFIIAFVLTGFGSAQSKKTKTPAKPVAKATATQKKVDSSKSAKTAKDNKSARKGSDKNASKDTKKSAKNDKLTAKERGKEKADAKSQKETKGSAKSRQAAAERRRVEAERRQAALAEKRRREQVAREARERKLAFERGLRTETVANILNDDIEGEDLAIRQAAISALGTHAGSVVVMEAQTGKVLTIVNQEWAVRSSIKPCSTIKLVTGVAGLNDGVVGKENGEIRDASMRLGLDDALAFSNNPYFQVVGSKVGNAKMIETAKQLGLGEPTGLNTTGETAGKLAIGNNNARIYSHGDDFEVSTLQLAVMVSAISNGGHRVVPRTPRNNIEKAQFQTFYRANIELPQTDVRRVIPGMMGAAEYGTARRGVDSSLGIAGKTGSCISKGSWVGLFASVAPIEQPKYSVVVITRGERERGRYAAAVAGQIYKALSSRIIRTDRNLAQTEFKLAPKFPAAAATAAVSEDDDDDASPEAGVALTGDSRPVNITQPAQKKFVTKTGQSQPIFPPVIITYDKEGNEVKRGAPNKP